MGRQGEFRLQPKIEAPLRVAGLFAGIGGIEEGLHRAGHKTTQLCEVEPGAQAVLRARFPGVDLVPDIRELCSLASSVDMITAGFPCQDLSQAGLTTGIEGSKSGLVGEVFRLLEKRRVEWVLLENVPFMLQLAKGKALDVIIGELERLRYKWAYRVVDSRAFGLPQRRQRVFLLASMDHDPRDVLLSDDMGPPDEPTDVHRYACGFYWTEGIRGLGWAVDAIPTLKGGSTVGIPSPPAILFPSKGKGRRWGLAAKPDIRDAERMQGFDADWTLPAAGVVRGSFRWKLVGNAVTVNVAEWIGTRLARPVPYDALRDPVLVRGGPWPAAAWNVDGTRHVSSVSAYPVQRARPSLIEFLKYDAAPLSAKATRGFLARTARASLRFPAGFRESLQAHLERVAA
jgi:DNA (cytosine-5)-methyltransferase 1